MARLFERGKPSESEIFEQLYSLEDIVIPVAEVPPSIPESTGPNTIDLTDEVIEIRAETVSSTPRKRSNVLKRRPRRSRKPAVAPVEPTPIEPQIYSPSVETVLDQVDHSAISQTSIISPIPLPIPETPIETPDLPQQIPANDDTRPTVSMSLSYWRVPKSERAAFVSDLESKVSEKLTDKKQRKRALREWRKAFDHLTYSTAWEQGGFKGWAGSRLKKWTRRGVKWGLIGALAAGGFGAIAVPATVKGFHYFAISGDDGKFADLEVIKQEYLPTDSTAFASDGTTELGSLMSTSGSDGMNHRDDYLKFEDIPDLFYQAMKASEDKRFDKDELCNSYGPDWCGMASAVVNNFDAYIKKLLGQNVHVPGGSNLVMQTVDNLRKIKDDPRYKGNAFKAKIPEIIDAMRLKHHQGPEGVFEIYANIFFTSGKKYGYPSALKHHFNISVEQASEDSVENLVRNAFIAGSVKFPSHVDVVVATNGTRAKRMKKAISRTRYVLGRMVANEFITEDQHEEAITFIDEDGIPFNHGSSKFRKDLIIQEVTKETKKLFSSGGACEDRSYSDSNGTKVVTTIDPELQPLAHYTLQRALSMWTVQFDGYHSPQDKKGKRVVTNKPTTLEEKLFYVAEVLPEDVNISGKDSYLTVRFRNELEGVVDYESLRRIAHFEKQHDLKTRGVRKKRVKTADVEKLLTKIRSQIEKGHKQIYVSFTGSEDGVPHFDLEQQPSMEASFMLMDAATGKIRSMVGSFNNVDFNYLTARGDFGSAGKALVHAAASLRGWKMFGDQYRVRADVAAFKVEGGNYYTPKNFESTQFKWDTPIQMVAASRNLSNVGMLLRWWDHLSPEEFETALNSLGLLQQNGESVKEYISRGICSQGKVGGGLKFSPIKDYIKFKQGDKERVAFEMALQEYIISDATDIDREWVRDELLFEAPTSLISGLQDKLRSAEDSDDLDLVTDIEYQLETFAFNFLDLLSRARIAREKIELARGGDSSAQALFFKNLAPAFGSSAIFSEEPISYLKKISPSEIASEGALDAKKVILAQTYIPNKITVHTIEEIQRLMQPRLEQMDDAETLYTFEYLQHHPQFKVLAAEMDYREYLKKLGMDTSQYQCIYGVVLGNIPTRMIDLATVYASQYTGKLVHPTIIDHYIDRDGVNICENTQEFADIPEISDARRYIADMQHAVAMYGTAASLNRGSAKMSVDLNGTRVRIWAGGKTGTGNESRFVTFVGVIPNLEAQFGSLSEVGKTRRLKDINLDNMLVGVVKVQEYRPGNVSQDQPMEYGCNDEGKHCSMQMFGSTAAGSIFVPVARAELQRNAHLLSSELGKGDMVDLRKTDGTVERYVYLGNRRKEFGSTVYSSFEGSEVDPIKCIPLDRVHRSEYCELSGSDRKRKIFTIFSDE